MTKTKMSISIDQKTVKLIQAATKTGKFRNKSHAVEFAIKNSFELEE